jgi:Reverse transcriptase (RNA-dependent DNA polymerase)
MEYYGIRGVVHDLYKSYLSGRYQAVSCQNTVSDFLPVAHGIPQGSILGPLLFLIYTNDLSDYMRPVKSILFADDTTFVCSAGNKAEVANCSVSVLAKAEHWFVANRLKLNSNKTQVLEISTVSNSSNGTSARLLGITLDSGLTWKCHISSLRSKLCSVLFLLRRLGSIVDLSALRPTYFSLFHSRIGYGTALWGNSTDATSIFRLQKKALRIMAGAGFRQPCKPLFISFKVMSLPSLYLFSVLISIHSQSTVITKQSDIHDHHTRLANNLRTGRYRLEKSKRNSPDYNLYNILPENFKKLSRNRFKKELKCFLLINCFYSVQEYIEYCRGL